jgi:hypothetical protein
MFQYDILYVSVEKMIKTHPLGAPNIEMFCANKLAHFKCYFEQYLYKPEMMYMDICGMQKCISVYAKDVY